jgi:hypothetical protein
MSPGERVDPGKMPEFIEGEAYRLYEAIQEAESAARRLAEALDWEVASGDAEARPRRTRARRLHRRLFGLLDAAETVLHENERPL